MRCYPESDVNFRVEYGVGWDRYCRWPNKKWAYKDLSPTPTILYWRDIEGAKKDEILMKDLYFDKWLKSRLRENVCLPLLYATGNRFIRLEKLFPAGFRCAPLPMNLQEYKDMQACIKEEEKQKKKTAKEKKEKEKAEKGKGKGKGTTTKGTGKQ
ncbi:uncharacterized protein [Eurosta solidaginis]|uniref:uncharacterized protein n=1 Tax=Eurosta solidaginis TaxID=178769 RepID=UPI00353116F3